MEQINKQTFEDFLKNKKINPALFLEKNDLLYNKLKNYYCEISSDSFSRQKKFLLNVLRLRFILK